MTEVKGQLQPSRSVISVLMSLIGAIPRLLFWLFRRITSGEEATICDEETPVFFDLETTGLDTSTCDIVQLSAISGNRTFNVYLLPRCTMTDGAARVTGLTVDRQSLHFRGRPVQTVPHRQALRDFISFLKTFNRPFLVGHNSRRFDWPILTRVLADFCLLEEWGGVVSGCVDTLGLSREMFRLHKYSQQFLVQHFLQQSYGAHDASEDVRTLQDLYRAWNPPEELVKKHKISTAFLHYH